MPKSYHSPWEEAIISDPTLADTLQLQMPVPEPKHDLPDYKSFNRYCNNFAIIYNSHEIIVSIIKRFVLF